MGIGLVVFLGCLALTATSASAATISGLVFNDFNTTGVFEDNPTTRDVPLEGFTVKAFTGIDTEVGHAVTNAEGHYSMDLPDTNVRLQLFSPGSSIGVEPPWYPTRVLAPDAPGGVRSDVVFIDASSPHTVDFGAHRPIQFSIEDPTLFWPTQWTGAPGAAGNPNNDEVAIRGAPYSSKRPPDQVQTWADLPGRVNRATFAQVGTVFGLAEDNITNDLYAGAYQKRFAGLKDGPGAIFKITPQGQVSVFAHLPAGSDPHPMVDGHENPDIEDWVNCGFGANSNTPATLSRCDFSWTDVGKIGLGGLVIDPQDQNLYTVNLENKSLYRIPLSDPEHPVASAIPNPGCVGGDWRPFSVAFDVVNDQLYVGGVCDASIDQSAADLRAVVYRVDNPQALSARRARAAAASFVQVLSFPLNYQRAPNPTLASVTFDGHSGLTARMDFCRDNTVYVPSVGGYCRWYPWPTTAANSTRGYAPSNARFGNERNNASFPQLTAITFAEDGSMILGFRDLMGDMGGVEIPGEMGPAAGSGTGVVAGQSGLGPMLHGDMLRAGAEANGDFTLEANGRVAGITSNGQIPGRFSPGNTGGGGSNNYSPVSPINWGYGPGIGPGHPGGYFYNPRPLATFSLMFQIPHPYQGGLIQIPGFADVVATSIHIRDAQENGLLWRNNDTGETAAALQNYITVNPQTGFAKSNGLGDITAYTGVPPVQIGNRLWYDAPDSGIQEPSEPPVTDTEVQLLDCAGNIVDYTRTDSQGEYYFNIEAHECYKVHIPLGQPSIEHWRVTRDFVGGHSSTINSKCLEMGANAVIDVADHGPGQNNFTYDCGFTRTDTPPPPPPPPPPPEHQLELFKHFLSQEGRTVRFEIIVRNSGPNPIVNVRVCDTVPHELEFVSVNAPGASSTGQQVCWEIASLPAGAEETFVLTTRIRAASLMGTATNCVDAHGTGEPEGPDVPGPDVVADRDCASVHEEDGKVEPEVTPPAPPTPPTPPPLPPPPRPTPVPPPPPSVHHQLELFKHLLSQVGRTVEWQITVRNTGTHPIVNVRVGDTLPAELEFVSVNAPGATSTGQQVSWTIGSLPARTQETFVLRTGVRAPSLEGTAVNCVDAHGTGEPTGRTVTAPRACAAVHGKVALPPPFTG